MAPSCALAEYRNGHLSVWSHTQGVYPLRSALANVLGLSQDAITVRHAHGAGCYGHNGADDVAVDAAVIALQIPDHCIRVQWRREEEFGFEPFGTAMHVTLRAALDDAGKPVDWTAEIWAATHVQRPSSGGNMLTHEALPTPPPDPRPTDPPEANGGGGTRNAFALYDFPVKRVRAPSGLRAPVRTSALRGLGALPNVFAIECFMDELAERAGRRSGGVSAVDAVRSARAAADRERGAAQQLGGARAGGQRARAGPGLGAVQEPRRLCRRGGGGGGRPGGAAATGVVRRGCGAGDQPRRRAQPARGRHHAGGQHDAEGTGADGGRRHHVARLGELSDPAFSEVPEIDTEIIHAPDLPTLGMGECTFGPTAAAIGNAVAHALGTRIREMPFTRERIEAALLQ